MHVFFLYIVKNMTFREKGKKTEIQYILQTAFPGEALHS